MKQKKRVKDYEKNVTIEGGIGLGSSSVGGSSTCVELDISEFEKRIASLKSAKELMPQYPIDEELIKKAGPLFDRLSDEAKKNLNYLVSGNFDTPSRHYAPGTCATWVVDYLTTYLSEYEKMASKIPKDIQSKLNFWNNRPIGVIVTLSEIKGIMFDFVKKNTEIQFQTWDLPVSNNIITPDGQKRRILDGQSLRAIPEDGPYIWRVASGSEDPKYFTKEKAIADAREHFTHDMSQIES